MTTTPNEQHPEAETKQIKWGARLKAVREAMGLTEKDAAARLHLKPHIIDIIENERFESGPPAIFMRGYVKSYAKLLNLKDREVEQMLSQLSLQHPEIKPTARPYKTQTTHVPHNTSYTGLMTVLVVVVLTALVGVWWNKNAHNTVSTETIAQENTAQESLESTASNLALNNNGPVSNDNSTQAIATAQETISGPMPAELSPQPANPQPMIAPTDPNIPNPGPRPNQAPAPVVPNPAAPAQPATPPPPQDNRYREIPGTPAPGTPNTQEGTTTVPTPMTPEPQTLPQQPPAPPTPGASPPTVPPTSLPANKPGKPNHNNAQVERSTPSSDEDLSESEFASAEYLPEQGLDPFNNDLS